MSLGKTSAIFVRSSGLEIMTMKARFRNPQHAPTRLSTPATGPDPNQAQTRRALKSASVPVHLPSFCLRSTNLAKFDTAKMVRAPSPSLSRARARPRRRPRARRRDADAPDAAFSHLPPARGIWVFPEASARGGAREADADRSRTRQGEAAPSSGSLRARYPRSRLPRGARIASPGRFPATSSRVAGIAAARGSAS